MLPHFLQGTRNWETGPKRKGDGGKQQFLKGNVTNDVLDVKGKKEHKNS